MNGYRDWRDGGLCDKADEEILQAAEGENRVFVTFDVRTISPMVAEWARDGRVYAGVIFIDEKTIAQNDVGGLTRALARLVQLEGASNWTGRAHFLQRTRID